MRWPLTIGYLAASLGILFLLAPRIGTEIFPDVDAPLYRIRLRAPVGTRIEETERIVLHALDIIKREVGPDQVAITSDFMGVQPSSYPVNLIHLFTAGPQEAVIQISLKPDAAHGEALRERLRASFAHELAGTQISFEAGDIVSQVMSFGSPTPIEVAVQGINLQVNSDYGLKVRAKLATLGFLQGPAVCARAELSDSGYRYRPGARRTVRAYHGGRGPVGGSGDFVLPVHVAELLAGSGLRKCFPDPSAASAEPDAEYRGDRRPARDAGWAA